MADLNPGTVVSKPARNLDGRARCTACGRTGPADRVSVWRRHPRLGVLTCRRCARFYFSEGATFPRDSSGEDRYCRWCAQGGNLFSCDRCPNVFCRSCITRNLGERETRRVKLLPLWACYACEPAALAPLRAECDAILAHWCEARWAGEARAEMEARAREICALTSRLHDAMLVQPNPEARPLAQYARTICNVLKEHASLVSDMAKAVDDQITSFTSAAYTEDIPAEESRQSRTSRKTFSSLTSGEREASPKSFPLVDLSTTQTTDEENDVSDSVEDESPDASTSVVCYYPRVVVQRLEFDDLEPAEKEPLKMTTANDKSDEAAEEDSDASIRRLSRLPTVMTGRGDRVATPKKDAKKKEAKNIKTQSKEYLDIFSSSSEDNDSVKSSASLLNVSKTSAKKCKEAASSQSMSISSEDESYFEEADLGKRSQAKKYAIAESEKDLNSDEDSRPRFTNRPTKSHKLLKVTLSSTTDEELSSRKTTPRRQRILRSKCNFDDGKADRKSSILSDSENDFDLSHRKRKIARSRPVKRKRIFVDSSSDSEQSKDMGNRSNEENLEKGRKNIRKIVSSKKLAEKTIEANLAEKERRKRVAERQRMYNIIVQEEKGEKVTSRMILDRTVSDEVVEIDANLVTKLKPHQVEGVKFLWECTVESLSQLRKGGEGSGCILAHCMGLGKTLQIIVYLHTMLTNPYTSAHFKTALVLCPYNAVLNWVQEFDKWLKGSLKLNIYELSDIKKCISRDATLKEWQEKGGVMILTYDLFRLLAKSTAKTIPYKLKKSFSMSLLDPGPDLMICDEGHILKNLKTLISKVINKTRTKRRVILTGTPLQNNLEEYHSMVQFVKPHLLGTKKEFQNRFVNPIINGQCADSNAHDVNLMKKRVHILHSLLEGSIQRYDYSSLQSYLLPKHEYVISVRLSNVQIKMYQHFLENLARGRQGGAGLFCDYNVLKLIWTHPHALLLNDREKREQERFSEDGFVKSDDSSSSSDVSSTEARNISDGIKIIDDSPKETKGTKSKDNSSEDETIKSWKSRSRSNACAADTCSSPKTRNNSGEKNSEISTKNTWWAKFFEDENIEKINFELGGKIILFLDILKTCEIIGDKLLVFSQSLLILDLIEEVLNSLEENVESSKDLFRTWELGLDYFRMDGNTKVSERKRSIKIFNAEYNYRARLFLISTKAGSLGTNLIGANRVIIMDASWNPTHDVQSIFRVYRFGQKKPVYIYRFLAQGTMEEKIYDRQVTKESLSYRVMDEQQIERHFKASDLAELYSFSPDMVKQRSTPVVPKDRLLAELLISQKDWISTYHEHDSLLQNLPEENLTEEERKAAWKEFEAEKEGRAGGSAFGASTQSIYGVTINHHSTYETVVSYPDAGVDATQIIEHSKKLNPAITKEQIHIYLYQAMTFLRNHYLKIQMMTEKQQAAWATLNVPVPPKLVTYLSHLVKYREHADRIIQNTKPKESSAMTDPSRNMAESKGSGLHSASASASKFSSTPLQYRLLKNTPRKASEPSKVSNYTISMPMSEEKMNRPTCSKSCSKPPKTCQSTVEITELQ